MRTNPRAHQRINEQASFVRDRRGSELAPSVSGTTQPYSVFAHGVEITGDLHAQGAVFLDGAFNGELLAGQLTVGQDGAFKGNAQCAVVEARGCVDGVLSCQSFVGFEGATVTGVVRSASIELQAGVSIKADLTTLD